VTVLRRERARTNARSAAARSVATYREVDIPSVTKLRKLAE
jgi:hypothetical protein